MAITITTSPPASPHVLIPAVVKMKLAEVAGPDGNLPYAQIGALGVLDSLLSDANVAGLQEIGGFQYRPAGPERPREVEVVYPHRVSRANVGTNASPCAPQTCNTFTSSKMVFTIDRTRSVCGTLPRAFMNRLVNPYEDREGNQPTVSETIARLSAPDMGGMFAGYLMDNIRALREVVNQDVASQLAVLAPTFVPAGPTPPPVPIQIPFTNTFGNKVHPAALAQMGEFIDDLGLTDPILLYGKGSLYKALWLLKQGYRTANLDGINLVELQQAMGGMANIGRLTPFFDRELYNGTGFTAGDFIVWQKGAIQLLYYSEYDAGAVGLPTMGGYSTNGTTFRFSMPDPKYGERFKYDVEVNFDPCVQDAESGLFGTWRVWVRANYGIWVYPSNIWPSDHPLYQTRRALYFRAIADDECVQVCENEP
ncbi:MAG: hypothetical protein RMM53_07740 [Bacteroidia bacterium]|nr:hypothetical protein [Bacteroidia bacterium]